MRKSARKSTRTRIADEQWQDALAHLPFIAALPVADGARLRTLTEQFLDDKEMAGAGDLQLRADLQISIAAQACLPILNLGLAWYRGWRGIVIYPDEFVVRRTVADEDGVVHEFDDVVSGEAWDGGPVILSLHDGPSNDDVLAYNVVIHEFTHKLDLLGGDADGLPPFDRELHAGLVPAAWRKALVDAMARLAAEVELIESALPADIDPDSVAAEPYYAHLPLDAYAVQDEAEFFAVSSESFFVQPARLQQAFPQWYQLLTQFFLQDPAARTAHTRAST